MTIGVDVKLNIADFEQVTREAVRDLSEEVERRSRDDVASGGLRRFVKGVKTRVRREGKGYIIDVNVKPGWISIFEHGGTSVGQPMLWIPAPGNIFPNLPARKYPGKLFRPKGSRVLINPVTRKVAYIGIPKVTIAPRLHLVDIAEQEANDFVNRLKGFL